MKYIFTFLLVYSGLFFFNSLQGQVTNDRDYIPGTLCVDKACSNVDHTDNSAAKGAPGQIQNGNGSIATTYTVSACGLNFAYSSVRLNQRSFGGVSPPTGSPQPTGMNLTLPACASGSNIVRAFLYCGLSGNGAAISASIINPLNVTTTYPMTMIGSHFDKCWGYVGTYNYRADVTSCISGGGSYTISGLPNVIGTNDTDGAVLFIIYRDPSQTYTGHFIIADGCVEGSGTWSQAITGFNVCGATNSQTNFMAVGDLQRIAAVPFKVNSAVDNFTYPLASQQVWDFFTTNVAACTSGQTSATFGITTSGDCWNIVLAGMYYRTSCLACTSTPCTPLPIELLSFNANCAGETVDLSWETATEKDNKSYTILRSEDGINFDAIITLPGARNSNDKRSYNYNDKTVANGHGYYYRLTQTDINNKTNEVGETRFVLCKSRKYAVEVYPTPSGEELFVTSENDLNGVTIDIIDGFGQKVKTFYNVFIPKDGKMKIETKDLINGCYQMVVSGNESVIQKKIIIYK